MWIRGRSKSSGVRRHEGTDENRMNVIQMKCQSVVEIATIRKSTKDIPFDHVRIYGFYSFLLHCYVYRIAAGTTVSYLPISPSSPTSLSDCFFFQSFSE